MAAVAMAALLFAASVPLLGGSVASAAQPREVPIAGVFGGTLQPTGAETFSLQGAGGATHLGPVAYEAAATITGLLPDGLTDTLVETLTARDGSSVTIFCSQVATEISPGVFHGVDTWTVVGGTGRFSGATGSGSGQTDVDLNTGVFNKAISGTITTR